MNHSQLAIPVIPVFSKDVQLIKIIYKWGLSSQKLHENEQKTPNLKKFDDPVRQLTQLLKIHFQIPKSSNIVTSLIFIFSMPFGAKMHYVLLEPIQTKKKREKCYKKLNISTASLSVVSLTSAGFSRF